MLIHSVIKDTVTFKFTTTFVEMNARLNSVLNRNITSNTLNQPLSVSAFDFFY